MWITDFDLQSWQSDSSHHLSDVQNTAAESAVVGGFLAYQEQMREAQKATEHLSEKAGSSQNNRAEN